MKIPDIYKLYAIKINKENNNVIFIDIAEPQPHNSRGARTVKRCGSGSDFNPHGPGLASLI
jgi:hypothetical protein